MTATEVRVLGPMEVVGDDGPVPLPAKHRHLLAALVVAGGRSCGVDELVEAVWGEAPPPSARKLLQIYVSQLRKALPGDVAIATRAGAYALEVPSAALDAARFERLLGESVAAGRGGNPALAASLADQALALWRGRAYGELAYEDVARAEAERLEELRLRALEERIEAQLAVGRHAEVIGEVLALSEQHPLRERLHEQAMLALYLCGRQSDALEHFASARARLRDELGLEPGAALRDLQRRILRQDPKLDVASVDPPRGGALPAPPSPLIGRDSELEELRRLLARRESRLLVLTGAGGSGKTRLALEAAREAAGTYANGAVLVELAPLRDPALVIPTIAHALDVADKQDEELLETLVRALAPRELLLVLDNAEHLREAAAAFAELVARAPRLTLLVTSRAVLHVSGEHVFPVAPLDEDDAVELFVQRARKLQPSFERTDENEPELREICRRVDGLPLAVELAAARIRTLTPRVLRERLGASLSVLTGGPRDLPARQQTLRETIEWSVRLLDERARHVFARLAVFPSGATLEAAETVCGGDLDTLGELVDHHLVQRTDARGEPRFGLLETVREYAFELLGDERQRVERALGEHLAGLVERAEPELKGPAQAEWLALLDSELDNLRAALDAAAAAGGGELELRLTGRLWRYWWIRGALDEGLGRILGALARDDAAPPSRAKAHALQGAAGLAWSKGNYAHAKALARTAIDVAKAIGSTVDEMAAHTVLGVSANSEREFETARRHFERSRELAEQLGLEPLEVKMNLAVLAHLSGDAPTAVRLFEELLEYHRGTGSPEGIGLALLNLGLARVRLGNHESARGDFAEARDAFELMGFRAHVAHALQGLAATDAAMGCPEDAARRLGLAQAHLNEVAWSSDDFDPTLADEVEVTLRRELGDERFAAAFAAGRESAAAGSR